MGDPAFKLELPGEVTDTHWRLPESLTREEWEDLGTRLNRAEKGHQWWIGDWAVYGNGQTWDPLGSIAAQTKLARKTISNAQSVSKSYNLSRRRERLSFFHHSECAALEPEVADALLDRAEREGLTRKQLRQEVYQVKQSIAPPPSLETCTVDDLRTLAARGVQCGTIYADPPWSYGNQGTRAATGNHYGAMTIAEIAALPVAAVAADNAHLHLWVTASHLPYAFEIITAWGFSYRTFFAWVKGKEVAGGKPQIGLGNYWRVSAELLLLGVRGSQTFLDHSLANWFEGAADSPAGGALKCQRGEHSKKPEQVRQMIERASPGPRLELFGRQAVDGWMVWGNQVERDMFTQSIPHFGVEAPVDECTDEQKTIGIDTAEREVPGAAGGHGNGRHHAGVGRVDAGGVRV